MYTEKFLRSIELKYSAPKIHRTKCVMSRSEFDLLKWSMRRGRSHDVTPIIFNGDQIAVIRKQTHPPGVYRPPSGGVEPNEDFEIGIHRETFEETGLKIEIDRYILKCFVDFHFEDQIVNWTTHVFTANAVTNQLQPIDLYEIAEARWASVAELKTDLLNRLRKESAGLRYRAELQTVVLNILDHDRDTKNERKNYNEKVSQKEGFVD